MSNIITFTKLSLTKRKSGVQKNRFNKIMAENFPYLMKMQPYRFKNPTNTKQDKYEEKCHLGTL